MALDVQHWLEVLFDGVGGAALIAFFTAWNDRKREKQSAKAPGTVKRSNLWMAVAAVFFVVCLCVGGVIHVFGRSPAVSEQAKPAPSLAHPAETSIPALDPPTTRANVPTVGKSPKRAATTADEIIALISEQLQVGREDVSPEKDMVLDLGATPTDKAEIVMMLETDYGIQIPRVDAQKFKSVGDIINYMERREHKGKAPDAR